MRNEKELLLAEAAQAAKAAAEEAEFNAWLSGCSDEMQAHAFELFELQHQRKMAHGFRPSVSRDRRGRVVYTIACGNGFHESLISHEHALGLLVQSFRTRVADLESTHEQLRSERVDVKMARKLSSQIEKEVDAEFPELSIEERDAIVLQRVRGG